MKIGSSVLKNEDVYVSKYTGREFAVIDVVKREVDGKVEVLLFNKSFGLVETESYSNFKNSYKLKEDKVQIENYSYAPVTASGYYGNFFNEDDEDSSHLYIKPSEEGEVKLTKVNVNQDILKLIEAGYEFSSFWGDTVDGRSINVDLNEEEAKQ